MNKQTMFYHIVNCLEKKQKGNTDETKPPLNLEPLHSNEKRWCGGEILVLRNSFIGGG